MIIVMTMMMVMVLLLTIMMIDDNDVDNDDYDYDDKRVTLIFLCRPSLPSPPLSVDQRSPLLVPDNDNCSCLIMIIFQQNNDHRHYSDNDEAMTMMIADFLDPILMH